MISGLVYIGISFVFLAICVPLYIFGPSLGYYYLNIGLLVLSVFSLVKGILVYYVSSNRHKFYNRKSSLSKENMEEERKYTQYRILKKQRNRRRYVYIMVLLSLIAVIGAFMLEKGLIIGTCVPIILFAAIEFTMGLLMEFRLSEYLRQLKK